MKSLSMSRYSWFTASSAVINAARQGGVRSAAALTCRRLFLCWLARRKELTIVQIGAYVGPTGNDPLHGFFRRHFDPSRESFRPNWRAVLVEPVPQYFQTLRQNYCRFTNITYEEGAIAASDGPVVMRVLSCDPAAHGIPEWASQLSSMVSDPANRPGLPESIREFWRTHSQDVAVQGLTIGTLIARHGLHEITLLQIDTEGADGDILESIDFDRLAPEFINFERINLGDQERRVRLFLRRAGYRLLNWGDDTFCFRRRSQLLAPGPRRITDQEPRSAESPAP